MEISEGQYYSVVELLNNVLIQQEKILEMADNNKLNNGEIKELLDEISNNLGSILNDLGW